MAIAGDFTRLSADADDHLLARRLAGCFWGDDDRPEAYDGRWSHLSVEDRQQWCRVAALVRAGLPAMPTPQDAAGPFTRVDCLNAIVLVSADGATVLRVSRREGKVTRTQL